MTVHHLLRRARRALAASLVLALAACSGGDDGSATTVGPKSPPPSSLTPASESSLGNYLREALGPASATYVNGPWATVVRTADGTVAVAMADTTAAGAAAGSWSTTNLQEAGVDEADRVQTDGTSVLSLAPAPASLAAVSGPRLQRHRFGPSGAKTTLAAVDAIDLGFSPEVVASGLYFDGTRRQAVVVGEGTGSAGVSRLWMGPLSWTDGTTEVVLVYTGDAATMQARRRLRLDGVLVGSRRVDATLYLVIRSYPRPAGFDPTWSDAQRSTNQRLLDGLRASEVLPTIAVDGAAAVPLVDPASCLIQSGNAVRSAEVVTVVAIDLASDSHRHAAKCFAGGTEAVYLTPRSLYLATTRSAYGYSGSFAVYDADVSTDIHKFALDGLDIRYRGSGNVRGHLGFERDRKSFRLSEDDGLLRVITQTATRWAAPVMMPVVLAADAGAAAATTPRSDSDSPARLTILKEDGGALATVASLPSATRPEPLGKPGEQLYATRFVGKRGYLVTYRLMDPLYVLDLSRPDDPRVAGTLEVSGYSDYLFPLSETLLLGIGKEAIADASAADGRFGWYQGVKLSLIDVADPARPREAARSIVGGRGTDATVLHDHHGVALQWRDPTKVRVALPVRLHEADPTPSSDGPWAWAPFRRTELRRFSVDLGRPGITESGALASDRAGERDIGNDRALLWNDQVHYYQDGRWLSAPW